MQSGRTRVVGESGPLFGAELHPPPVIEPGFVLPTERHTKGFVARGFGIRNMGLKFNGIRPGVRSGIYEHVCRAQRPVMGLRHFCNQVGGCAATDGAA
jgi:hypothetical protein